MVLHEVQLPSICIYLVSETMQWREITGEGSPPSPRDKLRSVAMGAKILFFGGFGPISDSSDVQSGQAEFSWFNDLYSFDTGDPSKASPYNFA